MARTQKESRKGLSTTLPPPKSAGRLDRTALPPRKERDLRRRALGHLRCDEDGRDNIHDLLELDGGN